MKVYVVEHVHQLDDREDYKLIGIFSSQEKANDAVEFLKSQPGFRDALDGFTIDLWSLDDMHWEMGYITMTTILDE